jgi:hypothetical protein
LTEQGILVRHQRTAGSVAGGDRTEPPSIVFPAEGFLSHPIKEKKGSPDRVFAPYSHFHARKLGLSSQIADLFPS